MAQTSDRVSRIAARLMDFKAESLNRMDWADKVQHAEDVRAIAASALRQDQTPGKRLLKAIGLGPRNS